MSTSKLHCSLYQPVTKAFPTLLPYPLPPIWPNDPLPVLHSPALVAFGKVLPLSMLTFWKSRSFRLYYSLEPVFFFSALWTVCDDTGSGKVSWSDFSTWTAVSALPVLMWMAWHIVVEFSLEGLPLGLGNGRMMLGVKLSECMQTDGLWWISTRQLRDDPY